MPARANSRTAAALTSASACRATTSSRSARAASASPRRAQPRSRGVMTPAPMWNGWRASLPTAGAPECPDEEETAETAVVVSHRRAQTRCRAHRTRHAQRTRHEELEVDSIFAQGMILVDVFGSWPAVPKPRCSARGGPSPAEDGKMAMQRRRWRRRRRKRRKKRRKKRRRKRRRRRRRRRRGGQ